MKAPEPPLLQVKSDCFCIYVLTGIFLKLVISISLIQPARAKKFDDEEIFWCQHPCLSEYPNSDCIRFAVITVQSFFFFSAQSLTSQVVSFSKTYMGSFCNSSPSTKQPKIRQLNNSLTTCSHSSIKHKKKKTYCSLPILKEVLKSKSFISIRSLH